MEKVNEQQKNALRDRQPGSLVKKFQVNSDTEGGVYETSLYTVSRLMNR